ncbi:MAG TPA: response regulator [Pirellulales bacterium]|nr:response regulator [Pirellulales bacterium]
MSAGLNILIADERAAAHEAAALIERWGHRVQQTHDGLVAVDQARAFKPDLMLLGLSLPGLNGLGVAHRLQKLPALEHVRLTALVNEPVGVPRRELKKAGFSDTLLKPIAPIELLMSIVKTRDAIFKARSLTRSAREIVARGRTRVESARLGADQHKQTIALSRASLSRPSPGVEDQPYSTAELLEALIAGDYLDADHRAVACKVLSVGEPSLFAWETSLFARVRQRFLQPACKLCRYRIPAAEVAASWTNGGYCALCLDAIT